jgi:hypothetical protein
MPRVRRVFFLLLRHVISRSPDIEFRLLDGLPHLRKFT